MFFQITYQNVTHKICKISLFQTIICDVINKAFDGGNIATDARNAASDARNAASDARNAASDARNAASDARCKVRCPAAYALALESSKI